MIKDAQIKKLGFLQLSSENSAVSIYEYKSDDTHLLLTRTIGNALFMLFDGRKGVYHFYWQGNILTQKTLVSKLVRFGNNLLKSVENNTNEKL